MDYAAEIAKQGLGYLLAVVMALVVVYQNRKLDNKDKEVADIHEKRLGDANQYTTSFTQVAKDMVGSNKDQTNAMLNMQKSLDSLTQLVQNLIIDGKRGKQ